MPQKTLPLILCASIAFAFSPARAQNSGDPSETFLNAYSAFQRAEKVETSGNAAAALNAYKEAARLLDQVSNNWPTWNPSVVDFRRKRTAEAIAKIQGRMSKAGTPAGAPGFGGPEVEAPLGGNSRNVEPPLPGEDSLIPVFPNSEPMAPMSAEDNGARPAGRSSNPIQEIQEQMDRLQRDLRASREELEKLRHEKDELARQFQESSQARAKAEERQKLLQQRADNAEAVLMKALAEGAKEGQMVRELQEARDKARKELRQIQIDREAAEEVRQQVAGRLTNAQNRIANLSKERDAATKLSSEASARIAEAQKKMEAAIKERNELSTKLAKVTQERDDALQQVAKMKESQKQVDRLISENTKLMARLADAEKEITQVKEDSAEKEKTIETLQKEVGSVKKQLADAQKQSSEYQAKMGDLKGKLDATAEQIALLKTDNATGAADRKKMQDENDLLRGIVMRQMKEQARRDQTRKLVLDQMSKMEVRSKDLLTQINYLGQPVVKLTEKERALFKKPQIEISETEVSIATAKPDDAAYLEDSVEPVMPVASAEPKTISPASATPEPVQEARLTLDQKPAGLPPENVAPPVSSGAPPSSSENEASTGGAGDLPVSAADGPSGLPAEFLPLVQESKDHFERGNYREAERIYEKILAKSPKNLYALSNLGVARFRSGKLKLAEEAFKKALAIAPKDGFSRCTLGIVYYTQERYDEAVTELTAALAVNPKNAQAHNYLGITASQKGWQDAALKELETATALDPGYADAHFNLAVVFATQQPPNKESARRYYKRATELGAEPDNALEALIK